MDEPGLDTSAGVFQQSAQLHDHRIRIPPSHSFRVCDRCIRHKVKCNQGRPACSRCHERGQTCTYSVPRRKPGPPRGSVRPRKALDSHRHEVTSNSPNPSPTILSAIVENDTPEKTAPPHVQSEPSETQNGRRALTGLDITTEQEQYLVNTFFDIMCDANPIFSKTRFLARYGEGHCSPDLTTTMVAVTAKITNMVQSIDRSKLDTCIDMLLTSSLQDDVMISDYASLDQFRKACILAFYEFHQFPGHQAWMRIGRLARIAYRVGLDRLESLRSLYYDWNTIEEEDMQEWRSIWWCIYRLDSYSNIASGTPYVVEDNLFSTSLFVAQTHMSPNGNITAGDLRLPPRSQGFWSIIPDILLDSENALMNIHNVTVAAMRQAGSMARVYFLRSKEESTAYTADLEQQISALRLALPTHWFSPRRNAFLRESQDAQHGRLVTVLHLLMAQLILSAIICTQGQSENWLVAWERVLETCQDIASVAANWDSAFCLKVDPAVAFVSFTALIMLELHRKSSALSDPNLESKIRSDQTALRLQLNHFAKVWMLPKLLTLSFESFAESIPDRLPEEDVVRILSRFEAPLHPRWLQFLSSAHIIPEIV